MVQLGRGLLSYVMFVLLSACSLLSLYKSIFWVGSILRNGTERNDGLNYGTECFLKLKLAAYHCCTSYQWHFQLVNKRTPRKIKRI